MNKTEIAILDVLATCRDRTAQQLREMTGETTSRIYTALFWLEDEAKVSSDWQPGSFPRKRRYRLALPLLTKAKP